MLNYLRAEFYKVWRWKYTWITLAVLVGLEGVLLALDVILNESGGFISFSASCHVLVGALLVGCFAPVLTCEMVCASPYKTGVLKNEVSFGISRATVYFGKLITQLAVSVIFCGAAVVFYVSVAALLLPHDAVVDPVALRQVGEGLLLALPVWIGIQGMCCAFAMLLKSGTGATLLILSMLLAIPYGMSVLSWFLGLQGNAAMAAVGRGLDYIAMNTPVPQCNRIDEVLAVGGWSPAFFGRMCAIGGGWLGASIGLGFWGFARREIS